MSKEKKENPVVAQADVREFSGLALHTEMATFKLGGLEGSVSNGVEGSIIVSLGARRFMVAIADVVRAVEPLVFPEGVPDGV
jgi:hypothetical protein